jgi:hypothetical protein
MREGRESRERGERDYKLVERGQKEGEKRGREEKRNREERGEKGIISW